MCLRSFSRYPKGQGEVIVTSQCGTNCPSLCMYLTGLFRMLTGVMGNCYQDLRGGLYREGQRSGSSCYILLPRRQWGETRKELLSQDTAG